MAKQRARFRREGERARRMLEALAGGRRLLVLLQDSPDPDALASAAALRHLVLTRTDLEVVVAYGGIIGRAENRALLRTVDLPVSHVRQVDFSAYDRIALVDTQPATGNNSLPPDAQVQVVIDHHPLSEATRRVAFSDVRPEFGATTTILYRYLRGLHLAISDELAVVMLYGIRSDTMELGRHATPADVAAYMDLYPRVDKEVLARIAHADLPPVYFQLLAGALERAEVTGRVVVSALGDMNNPDMISEVADLLLRLEGAEWVMCYGFYERRLLASVRTSDPGGNACKLMRQVIGQRGTAGGHKVMAGGQIPLAEDTVAERERLAGELVEGFRQALGVADRKPRRLLELASATAVITTSVPQRK